MSAIDASRQLANITSTAQLVRDDDFANLALAGTQRTPPRTSIAQEVSEEQKSTPFSKGTSAYEKVATTNM